jgi:membrane protein
MCNLPLPRLRDRLARPPAGSLCKGVASAPPDRPKVRKLTARSSQLTALDQPLAGINMRDVFRLLQQTFRDFSDDHGTRLAAALSYYTVFSLPPLLVLLLVLLGVVLDPADVETFLTGQVGSLLGPAGATEIRNILQHAERPDLSRGVTALIGIGALLFGAIGAFVELQNALNRIWEVEPDPRQGGVRRFIGQRLVSFGMLLTIAFLLLVSLVISAALAAFGDALERVLPEVLSGVVLHMINLLVSLVVISFLFAQLFRHVPDAQVEWSDVRVGAAVTGVLFIAGKFALGFYLGRSDPGSAFGATGSLALLLVWIYYSAIILFLGAEFTQAWARGKGRGITPAPGAVRMIERKEAVGRG